MGWMEEQIARLDRSIADLTEIHAQVAEILECAGRQQEARQKSEDARDAALAALRELVLGLEALYCEENWDCFAEEIDAPYEKARAVLGSPVVMLPGGFDGGHFHFLKDEGEPCVTCEEERDELG